ncbi:MFS general substrate transporter [Mycena albidolilacea]|uniref:MFS general substrate transporter n=1 Tax=Mycena albidolilacea TaxID=1033008 RepID=A0AAD7F695_9AGAR|nr:MFS general substrate transporter [Mycena albidolilacea]
MSSQFQSKHYDPVMANKILRKLDYHILPPLALLWLCNFIDRSNVGNARIVGLEKDTHLHGNQFNIVLTVFYVTYLLVEVPSNLVMKKVKPNRWIPFLVFMWGGVTTLTSLVHNYGGLIAIRMFLGVCEGGLLPGMILYLSTIYKPHELQLRVGIFYASASLSGAFGGLLATAILDMDGIGNLAGWRWIFILEGLATVVASFIAAFFLPESIAGANFLTEEEKEFALGRFHQDEAITASTLNTLAAQSEQEKGEKGEKADEYTNEHTESPSPQAKPVHMMDEKFEMSEVIRGLTDFQAWVTGIAYLGLIVSLYSFSLFLPTIVSGLGYKGKDAQLHTVPPYVPATVLTVIVAILSDRLKWRGPFILICLPFAIAGYILAIAATTNAQRYGAVFLIAAGVYPSGPAILSILPNNGSGYYKRATTTALQLAVANSGGFIATNIYTTDQAPTYIRGHSIVLAFLILAWLLIAVNVWYCLRENKARAEGRRQGNITAYEEEWNAGRTRAPIGDRHPDFRFTL